MGSSRKARPAPQAVSKQWDTASASSKFSSTDGPLKYRNAIIVAAAAFVLLSLLSLTSSDYGPVQLSVDNSAQLKDVLYGGEPWIVLCDKSPEISTFWIWGEIRGPCLLMCQAIFCDKSNEITTCRNPGDLGNVSFATSQRKY